MLPCVQLVVLAISALIQSPAQSTDELPFELTREDVRSVDTSAIRWTTLRTFVGGAEAEFLYENREVTPEECRAAALIGAARLRTHYRVERQDEPVSLRMGFQCGMIYTGVLRYDGVNSHLEVREVASGELIYRGRQRGLP